MKITIKKISLPYGKILDEKTIDNVKHIDYHTQKEYNWLDVLYDYDNKYYSREPNPKEEYYFNIIIDE